VTQNYSFGDDVTYWDDMGDIYGAFFGNVRARESQVTADLAIIAAVALLGVCELALH
jgi:hypothetical protein